tara:strand:- start:499 stop:2244 length:1746 start_codon:yes stop_codon:yes gene_type:complete
MKLKSFKKYIGFFVFFYLFLPIKAEEQIDIWKNKNTKENQNTILKKDNDESNKSLNPNAFKVSNLNENSKIDGANLEGSNEIKIFGIYDPAVNNFSLNMWSETEAENIRSSIKRINNIKLSNTATTLFEKTIFSFAFPPKGMTDKEFLNLKMDWMIKNNRTDLIEQFLKQNDIFPDKKKIIQHLVDTNIAKANIKQACEKIDFIDKNIKDSYLEKFKIYCLVFNDKKNEAQLLFDILKEQKQSDNFFNDKLNYLLGITDKTSKNVRDDNLLNFYLSSVTTSNFKYEPKQNTKKIIWEYLNAANLIELEDYKDKEKLKSLEVAANENRLKKEKIFEIYTKIPFDLNSLIGAQDIYQTIQNKSDSRALIYQKFLLSDNDESKVKLLFLLDDMFKKDNLPNIFPKFMSDRLEEIKIENLPSSYTEAIKKKIISEEEFVMGKIKYDDKVLHRSKIIKYFNNEIGQKKAQKDFNKIYKKIKKNRKYFFSAKDLALIESLLTDGFKIPEDFNYKKISEKFSIPSNLLELSKSKEIAFLSLKLVEIIGEDEAYDLDPETIYFITHLLNQSNLKKIRNEILISALPQRI